LQALESKCALAVVVVLLPKHTLTHALLAIPNNTLNAALLVGSFSSPAACFSARTTPARLSANLPDCLLSCLSANAPHKQALRDMGVDEAFSDRAQFGKLSPTPLMIDDIYHSVSLTKQYQLWQHDIL
jgi:hypothetical protein